MSLFQPIIDLVANAGDQPPRPICVVGVNGAGKSRMLAKLVDEFNAAGKFAILQRAERYSGIYMNPAPQMMVDDFAEALDYVCANSAGSAAPAIDQFIGQIIVHGFNKQQRSHNQFVMAVANWIEGGNQGPWPDKPADQFGPFLESLGEILGHKLSLSPPAYSRSSGPEVEVEINGVKVPIANALSSGEKQILIFAVLLLQRSEQDIVMLVDEPELHLNEARAVELWERIERQLPKISFIYATHSLAFATRNTMGHLFVLEKDKLPVSIPSMDQLPKKVITELVGARINVRGQIGEPIFCEDDGHRLLLSDLFGDTEINPVVLNGRAPVIAAMEAVGTYDALFLGENSRCGVIDRDFLSTEEITAKAQKGIFTLPYNDFEACLLHPEIITKLLYRGDGSNLTLSEYESALKSAAEKSFEETIAKLARQIEDDFSPKIRYSLSVNREFSSLSVENHDGVADALQTRAAVIVSAIERCEVESILQNFKGKKLYKHFVNAAGQFNMTISTEPYTLYQYIRRLPDFRNALSRVAAFEKFRAQVKAYLSMR